MGWLMVHPIQPMRIAQVSTGAIIALGDPVRAFTASHDGLHVPYGGFRIKVTAKADRMVEEEPIIERNNISLLTGGHLRPWPRRYGTIATFSEQTHTGDETFAGRRG